MILVFHIFFDYGIQWKLYFDDLRSRSTIKGQLHKLSWKLPILVPSRHSQSGLVQNFETPALPQDFGRRREFSKFRIWEVPKSVVSHFFCSLLWRQICFLAGHPPFSNSSPPPYCVSRFCTTFSQTPPLLLFSDILNVWPLTWFVVPPLKCWFWPQSQK